MKHFTKEDVLKLKEQEQGRGGGCLAEMVGNIAAFGLVVAIVVAALSFASIGQPGAAVPTTATIIYGPTELVLESTPTLAPTATPPTAAPVLTGAAVVHTAVSAAPSWTPPATYTPLPTYTPAATHTAAPTYTPPPTWTPMSTWTAVPTWTPVPPYQVADYAAEWRASRAAADRLTWLALAVVGLAATGFALAAVGRPTDLRRLYRLLEMHLLATLLPPAPVAPVRALPAPVRTTPLNEYLARRSGQNAPVQNTGVTGVTGAAPVQNTGATPAPGVITVSVKPAEPAVDVAVMQAICAVWNEILERGERPSMNQACFEYYGSKNSDRLAIVNRAIKWGRGEGIVPPLPTSKTRKPT